MSFSNNKSSTYSNSDLSAQDENLLVSLSGGKDD
jgi:hypothetical protein